MSIFPYAYRMIETFDITSDSTQISMYAGMLITSFAFAEFSTGVIWGRISDKIGRKPVLIMGLIGTALSMVSFGFATSLPAAIVARALGGLLNGNVGVLQTTVAELVTSKEHQPRAYSIMPFVWCLGSIIGPAMGGALAAPCEAYPWLFPRDTIFARHPFLLPNLVCVGVLMVGIMIGLLFLEETHPDLKWRRDFGLELGRRIMGKSTEGSASPYAETKIGSGATAEFANLIENDAPPGYRSTEGSPRLSMATIVSPALKEVDVEVAYPTRAGRFSPKTFNKQVVMVIIGYGILA
jgi:MFS family permease